MIDVERAHLLVIASKLGDFVAAYNAPGIEGLVLGFACGRMLGTGASKAEVRRLFEQCLAQLPDSRDHEKGLQ